MKSRFLLYVPVLKNSVKTLFSFDAHSSLLIGKPSFLAKKPAKISPKLPVGTLKLILSPNLILLSANNRP